MKTHRIIFKGNLEPMHVEQESADILLKKIEDGDRGMIQIADNTFRISSIKAIIKLKEGIRPSGNYKKCTNRICNKQNRVHAWHEVCEYSETAECVDCKKKLLEKDRKHSVMVWKKVFCYDCSPLGKNIGSKPRTDAERFVNAFIHSAVQKGMSEAQAFKQANEMLQKLGEEFPEMDKKVEPVQLALPDKKPVQVKRKVKSLPF